MKRFNVLLLIGIFLLCTGFFNTAYCNTPNPAQETLEDNSQVEDDEYTHESVLQEDDESEYEEPKTDDVITSDSDEEIEDDESEYTETIEEEEV